MDINDKILVIDNYDSFTYNLVHQLRELGHGHRTAVYRNDQITVEQVEQYNKILLSPGPGVPKEAGIMPAIIERYSSHPTKSILGVCLGHQAIVEAYGGQIYNMEVVLHGITAPVTVTEIGRQNGSIFRGLPSTFDVCHYHSWCAVKESLPDNLEVTACDAQGKVMAIRDKQHRVFGVQFHPESVMTQHGLQIIENWLDL